MLFIIIPLYIQLNCGKFCTWSAVIPMHFTMQFIKEAMVVLACHMNDALPIELLLVINFHSFHQLIMTVMDISIAPTDLVLFK